jgi:hypothetical protein
MTSNILYPPAHFNYDEIKKHRQENWAMYRNTGHISTSIICSTAASSCHVIAHVESFKGELPDQIEALLFADLHAVSHNIEQKQNGVYVF